jgi:hypothetical protein
MSNEVAAGNLLWCIIHPAFGCMGPQICPAALELWPYLGTVRVINELLYPEYVVVAAFSTEAEALLELGVLFGN